MNETGVQPRRAIERFLAHEMSGRELLRCLATFDRWIVPAGFSGGQPAFLDFRSGQSRRFFMFSGPEAYNEARRQLGEDVLGDHYVETTGDSIWLSFNDAVAGLSIDPFSKHEIDYGPDQFPLLRRWGNIIRVERALEKVLSTDSGYDLIRDFDRYYIVTRRDESGPNLMLAPDSKGRKLAALFTAEDSLDAYLDEKRGGGFQDLEPLMMTGPRLFELLSRTPLDGFVFNCCGPIAPRAFAPAFAERISALAT